MATLSFKFAVLYSDFCVPLKEVMLSDMSALLLSVCIVIVRVY